MAVNIKVLLKSSASSTQEARRLELDPSSATNFTHIQEKIRKAFPTLQATKFAITWKDVDGDDITISSNDELATAFAEMPTVKTLYVSPDQPRAQPQASGSGEKPQDQTAEDFEQPSLESLAKTFLPLLAGFGVSSNPTSGPSQQGGCPMDLLRNIAENFLANVPKEQSGAEQVNPTPGGAAPQSRCRQEAKDLKLVEALAQLEAMGFSNDNGVLVRLLERFHGDVARVVTAMSEA